MGHSARPSEWTRRCCVRGDSSWPPPEIAGIEHMVGLFINTLPLRVQLPPAKPLITILNEVQDRQSQLMMHQHLGLGEIQSLAGLGGELFDTLFVFENYPFDHDSLARDIGGYGSPTSKVTMPATILWGSLSFQASNCSCGLAIGPTCLSGERCGDGGPVGPVAGGGGCRS